MKAGEGQLDTGVLAAAATLALDAATAQVVSALRQQGIKSILLRGPVLMRWLYDREARPYSDIDLLVEPSHFESAGDVLADLGFRRSGLQPPARHARTWTRDPDGAAVDLHRNIVGVSGPADAAWKALSDEAEQLALGGVTVVILRPAARAVLVALHAAQHGVDHPKPLEDLARALVRLPSAEWTSATSLAARLQATEAFAAGLRLLPEGDEIARRLGLPSEQSVETILRAQTAPDLSLGFERLARARGAREKLSLLRQKLFPDTEFMRDWTFLARRGGPGLAAAYLWRFIWLSTHAPAGFRAWLRAWRAAR